MQHRAALVHRWSLRCAAHRKSTLLRAAVRLVRQLGLRCTVYGVLEKAKPGVVGLSKISLSHFKSHDSILLPPSPSTDLLKPHPSPRLDDHQITKWPNVRDKSIHLVPAVAWQNSLSGVGVCPGVYLPLPRRQTPLAQIGRCLLKARAHKLSHVYPVTLQGYDPHG